VAIPPDGLSLLTAGWEIAATTGAATTGSQLVNHLNSRSDQSSGGSVAKPRASSGRLQRCTQLNLVALNPDPTLSV
jgi:hypothetical protein